MSKDSTVNSVTGEIEIPGDLEDIEVPSRRHEVVGVITVIIALVSLLALASYDGLGSDGSPILGGNIVGPAGTWMAFLSFTALGAAAYMINLFLWIYAACLFSGRTENLRILSIIGAIVIALLSCVALHTILAGSTMSGGYAPGGAIGTFLGELSLSFVSTVGTYIITFGGIILVLLLVTDISLYLVIRAGGVLFTNGIKIIGSGCKQIITVWREYPDEIQSEAAPKKHKLDNKKTANTNSSELKIVIGNDSAQNSSSYEEKSTTKSRRKKPVKTSEPSSDEELVIKQSIEGDFELPSLDLLKPVSQTKTKIDKEYLGDMANKLVKVLKDFGVTGQIGEVYPGPVVTMFEFQPKSGTKLSKIGGLSNEIAMALEVKRVRVVAPIPGKNAVGFELPNKDRQMVRLREILEDDGFRRNTKAKLPMALGKDIAGKAFTADLAKMPHLLMAGTTGSGKSVAVNTMLLSMLYTHTPDQLRMLLIDPKMIEFQPYNHIPHLLLPVVTDMSQACLALKWAVDEMERRYQLFADVGSRNLESYNAKVEKILEKAAAEADTPLAPAETETTNDGTVVEFGEIPKPETKLPEKLPLIVICIDELADLMMVAAKDVEISIARLAQKARAAGLHLIVATQRPSTDVVTGLIKANFPTRLSCQVSSGIDSRTILGTNGAENLLGNGDMLLVPPGTSDLKRVQGAFVSEEEIFDIVEFLKTQGLPTYDEDILKPREDEGGKTVDEEDKDSVYDEAVAIVAEAQACSISMIQRKLRIGYNRSARIVEIMEKEGVVSPANGSNKREVLISQL